MGIFKHFLLITFIVLLSAHRPVMAQDDDIIPETDVSPALSVPPVDNGSATPPVIIDESDSSGASDTEDYDN